MSSLGHRKEVKPFITERFSHTIPILHGVIGANMFDNTLRSTEINAGLCIGVHGRLICFEVRFIRGTVDILDN
jgi:hypothetical protein